MGISLECRGRDLPWSTRCILTLRFTDRVEGNLHVVNLRRYNACIKLLRSIVLINFDAFIFYLAEDTLKTIKYALFLA